MIVDAKNAAALKIPRLLSSESQSPVFEDKTNFTYVAFHSSSVMENQSTAVFEKVDSILNFSSPETNVIENWNLSQNDTFDSYQKSMFVNWFVYFLRCLVIPGLLFYISWILWELRFLKMRDPSNPLPLPSGRMGFPIIGEMIQFFVIVSLVFFYFKQTCKTRIEKFNFNEI